VSVETDRRDDLAAFSFLAPILRAWQDARTILTYNTKIPAQVAVARLVLLGGGVQLFEIKDKNGAVLHQIDGRRLDKANLAGLVLRCANLSGVGMTRAVLRKSDLCEADLSFANLASADLEQALLVRANLNCAMLIAASLAECDLREANLRHASMFQANLRGARLERTSLLGTDLSSVDLTDANLMGAIYDARTRWPDGFDPVAAGAVLKS
jgi:uncharacterized protein YjbI with pentapeptide repeats